MIISTATGCGAVLKEYKQHFSLDTTFSGRIEDIVSFLLMQPWPDTVTLKPLSYRVLVHTPCTRRNVLKTPLQPEQLLTKIPQLQIKTMNRPHCCGAAGTYMLEHADLAVPLAQQLLEECRNEPVDVIATTNIGCALHLHQQLQTMNPNIRVCHPITLLAESLGI
jgi:glycolate oxidase iron-sulfur subunit